MNVDYYATDLIYNALCERECGLECKRLIYNALCERECGLVCKRLIYNALCEKKNVTKI